MLEITKSVNCKLAATANKLIIWPVKVIMITDGMINHSSYMKCKLISFAATTKTNVRLVYCGELNADLS